MPPDHHLLYTLIQSIIFLSSSEEGYIVEASPRTTFSKETRWVSFGEESTVSQKEKKNNNNTPLRLASV